MSSPTLGTSRRRCRPPLAPVARAARARRARRAARVRAAPRRRGGDPPPSTPQPHGRRRRPQQVRGPPACMRAPAAPARRVPPAARCASASAAPAASAAASSPVRRSSPAGQRRPERRCVRRRRRRRRQRARRVTAPSQREGEIAVRLGEGRLQRGRAAQQRDALVVGAARDQRLAEVARGGGVVRTRGEHRSIVALGGVGVVVRSAEHREHVPRADVGRCELHRARAQLPRLGVLLAGGERSHAQKEGLDVFVSAARPPVGSNARSCHKIGRRSCWRRGCASRASSSEV